MAWQLLTNYMESILHQSTRLTRVMNGRGLDYRAIPTWPVFVNRGLRRVSVRACLGDHAHVRSLVIDSLSFCKLWSGICSSTTLPVEPCLTLADRRLRNWVEMLQIVDSTLYRAGVNRL